MCSSCAGALRREFVRPDDDFFSSGGDSLGATIVVAQIRQRLDASLSTRGFFERRTPARLVASMSTSARGFDAEVAREERVDSCWHVKRVEFGRSPPLLERVAYTVREDLGRAAREFGRAQNLAPGVVFLASWLEVLDELGGGAFPLIARFGDPTRDTSDVLLVTKRTSSTMAGACDWDALQRSLLHPEEGASLSTETRSAFSYRRSCHRSGRPPELASYVAPVPFGLVVVDGPETRFELLARSAADLPLTPDGLLEAYARRLGQGLESQRTLAER